MIKGYKQGRDNNFFKLDSQRAKAEKKKIKKHYNEQDDIDVDDLNHMSISDIHEIYGEKEED